MAARGWGKEAEFIPQSHTFFLTYTPVVRWQAPSLSNATRREGLKEKRAGASSAVRQYWRKTEVLFYFPDTVPTPGYHGYQDPRG